MQLLIHPPSQDCLLLGWLYHCSIHLLHSNTHCLLVFQVPARAFGLRDASQAVQVLLSPLRRRLLLERVEEVVVIARAAVLVRL